MFACLCIGSLLGLSRAGVATIFSGPLTCHRGWALDDLAVFCCPNPGRPEQGVRAAKPPSYAIVTVGTGRSAFPDAAPEAIAPLGASKPLFRSHLTREKTVADLEHVADGWGVRKTERLVGVDRVIVNRNILKAGGHAKQAHDELVTLPPPSRPWSSSTRNCPSSPRRGPLRPP